MKTKGPKPKTPDGRNIIDHYWYWKQEDIIKDLETKRLPFGILVSNLFNDFNIGSVMRNSNCFTAKEFYYYGAKKFDPRGSVGMKHYEKIIHLPSEEDLDKISGYTWVGIDNVDGAVPMDTYQWPENTLMVFGQEQVGVPQELLKRCKDIVYIRQFGACRSLNVGCASAIAMYDYTSKYNKKVD